MIVCRLLLLCAGYKSRLFRIVCVQASRAAMACRHISVKKRQLTAMAAQSFLEEGPRTLEGTVMPRCVYVRFNVYM